MVARGKGLIINIGFWAAQKYLGNHIYGMAKAATNKMSPDMANELRPRGVAVAWSEPMQASQGGRLDISNCESRSLPAE
jgi:NADP-dependent 3-hydroxy acid dehydrogenase YdfG